MGLMARLSQLFMVFASLLGVRPFVGRSLALTFECLLVV
jgi:hypothetical protein